MGDHASTCGSPALSEADMTVKQIADAKGPFEERDRQVPIPSSSVTEGMILTSSRFSLALWLLFPSTWFATLPWPRW